MSLQKSKYSGDWRREERGLLPCKHVKAELQLMGFAANRQDLGDGYYVYLIGLCPRVHSYEKIIVFFDACMEASLFWIFFFKKLLSV